MGEEEEIKEGPPLNVMVMDGDITHNWPAIFGNKKTKNNRPIHIYQASWNKIEVTTYPESAIVHMQPLHTIQSYQQQIAKEKAKQNDASTFNIPLQTVDIKPHFLLIRNQPRGALPVTDCLNAFYGLMMTNVPSMNPMQCVYMNLERPIMLSALRAIEKRVGHNKFPLINATYYSSERQMVIAPEMPAVIKIAHAHAGMGKIKVDNQTAFRDVSTIIALNDHHCTAESFIEPEYGIRVQKIGKDNYCVMKKMFTGSGWKSQFGGSMLTQIELTEEYKLWADECSKCFGGMDILAVDAIHGSKTGKNHIIELNGTAIGILPERWQKDSIYISEMVVDRLNEHYCQYCNQNEEN